MKVSDQSRSRNENAIASGELLPGDAIDDVALAHHYKVSRTPVREALLQLQAQGILSSTPRGGSMVAKMNLQQLLSLWELLAELEGIAVRLACERMTNDDTKAYATLQENNAIAVIDLAPGRERVERIEPLGFKDFMKPGCGLDASDKDGANHIQNLPVFGLYQPDGIACFENDGARYLITANEGEDRERADFTEAERFGKLKNAQYSQFNFRFISYSPQPRDVLYGCLEVIASRAGTDRRLLK